MEQKDNQDARELEDIITLLSKGDELHSNGREPTQAELNVCARVKEFADKHKILIVTTPSIKPSHISDLFASTADIHRGELIDKMIVTPKAERKTLFGLDISKMRIPLEMNEDDAVKALEMAFAMGRQTGKPQLTQEYIEACTDDVNWTKKRFMEVDSYPSFLDQVVSKRHQGGFATVDMETDMRPRAERRGHKLKPVKKNQNYLALRGKYG